MNIKFWVVEREGCVLILYQEQQELRRALVYLTDGQTTVRMVQISIRKLLIPFEWLEFAFECFETLSNGSNLHSNASNPVRMIRICIRMLRILFE